MFSRIVRTSEPPIFWASVQDLALLGRELIRRLAAVDIERCRRPGNRARHSTDLASRKALSSPGRDFPWRIREISESLTWDSRASFCPLRRGGPSGSGVCL